MPPDGIASNLDHALSALQRATMAFADVEADSGQTLRLALQQLIEVTGADAGAVAVPAEAGEQATLLAEHGLLGAGPVIRIILNAVLAEASAQAVINEPTAAQRASISGITSILCAPVRRRGKTLAAVYLDRRDKPAFDDVALRLADSFASVLGLAFDLTRQREWAEQTADEARAVAVHTSDFWRFGAIVTRNRPFAECLQLAERAAASDATVLLQGETGAGKEHLARCIHAESTRRDGPFVVVHCAATPFELLESALFGHAQHGIQNGATPAHRDRIEQAQGGTLLLAEIGELPLQLQKKLSRVLTDLRAAPADRARPRLPDVRIMAATQKNLREEVLAGRFRKELFLRLNVVRLTLPPLRQRVEDVPALARVFLQLDAQRSGRRLSLSEEALRALARHSWPGNIAEMQNVMEKLCVLSAGPEIGVQEVESHLAAQVDIEEELPVAEAPPDVWERIEEAELAIRALRTTLGTPFLSEPVAMQPLVLSTGNGQDGAGLENGMAAQEMTPGMSFREQMDDAARQLLIRTIRQEGSLSAAARALGMSRQHVYLKCKRLGLKNF